MLGGRVLGRAEVVPFFERSSPGSLVGLEEEEERHIAMVWKEEEEELALENHLTLF